MNGRWLQSASGIGSSSDSTASRDHHRGLVVNREIIQISRCTQFARHSTDGVGLVGSDRLKLIVSHVFDDSIRKSGESAG
jgi:hypothetical protein